MTVRNYFATSLDHIMAELERIDLLIQIQVSRARQVQKTDEEFHGLYIPEQEVDSLLSQPIGLPHWATVSSPRSQTEVRSVLEQIAADIGRCKAESISRGVMLRLNDLACLFGLTPFEIDVLLICLAPELDLRYERLYAYLQDDVTRKRPGVDLVLNLLCPSVKAKFESRRLFALSAPLFKHHLLSLFDDPSHQKPPLLGQYLKVDERVVSYLLGSDEPDSRLLQFANHIVSEISLNDVLLPDKIKQRLTVLTQKKERKEAGLILYFQGHYGVGKQSAARAICMELGIGLLAVDMSRLIHSSEVSFRMAIQLVKREAMLQGAALYMEGFDSLFADDKKASLEDLVRELENRRELVFLAGSSAWEPQDTLQDLNFIRIEFPRPSYTERLHLWKKSLNGSVLDLNETDICAVAGKFRFSGGQIRDAAATAKNLARWRNPDKDQVTVNDLYTACRLQSNRKLTSLARKITPHYKWDDIILPVDRLQQMRDICNYVKYRSLVYDEWGFDRKLSLGKGLNILFSGPSGTGKTMAADIIAGELGLDLYKIDLSTVVSKYIGETEKNLSRIFAEAETSNVILFFDEADALFGRRSEVHDSHDRYANIEISYLLQKMEEYDGVVILATNLRKNMDDAFVRRMHFTVEFPFPKEEDRRCIWEKIWPKDTPIDEDIDLDFLASRFEMAGGNIRNIALSAAFMAADDGRKVTMNHVIRSTQREYQKMGKVVIEGEFGERC